MVILVVGNGFDMAHKLPTSYREFLEFVKIYQTEDLVSGFPDDPLRQFIFRLKSEDGQAAKEAREILSRRNKLLEYYLSVYEKRCQEGKKGWIDFEAELAEIIKTFDSACEYAKRAVERGEVRYQLPDPLLKKLAPFIYTGTDYRVLRNYTITLDYLKEQANYLLNDLKDITRLLEIYLTEYVEKIETDLRIPNIQRLADYIDKVISFNYTDTYQRMYRGSRAVDCCYIHGKAEENSSVETCNMVLGIDEFLDSSREDSDNAFIWFKKFYQRIYKDTESKYIDWLKEDLEENKDRTEKFPLYVYFYGHSLDVTDKDVLEMLIKHENAVVRIFYHNKESMAKQIDNLVKVIGRENLIHMTRGKDRKIEFIQAKEACEKAVLDV